MTARGKERARLLDWLDEQTDDQVHQWLIQAEDGHETIVEYIKQKADRAAAGASWTLASVAGLAVGSAAGAGAASEQGSLRTAGGARLLDSAAKLQQQKLLDVNGALLWKLAGRDFPRSYVDTTGVVDRIRTWATSALQVAADYHSQRRWASPPSPLLVSGLVKTGKSYTLEHVVPAVVAAALCEQQQQQQADGEAPTHLADMAVLRLQGDQLECSGGATGILRSLLIVWLEWARMERVPLQEGALAAAEADLMKYTSRADMGLLGRSVLSFIAAVKVPVLVLCDEVQSLFLPTFDGELDRNGVEYMRNRFMKHLLAGGPHTVLWCLTGSSMAITWMSVAKMPPNGHAVIANTSAVHLPATYSAELMKWAWQQLQDVGHPNVVLNPQLLELCPRSIPLLVVLVETWIRDGCPSDVAAFLLSFTRLKLIDEALREWKLGLGSMPLSQRRAVLDLSVPAVGANVKKELHTGLQRFLLPHLDKKADGRYYLRDSHQRQIVRLLFKNDGELRESWSELEQSSASLTQLDGGWNLFYLGEAADYLLGPKASGRWQQPTAEPPPVGTDEFQAQLQVIADNVANKLRATEAAASGSQQQQQQQPGGGAELGPRELWEQQPWFQKVLHSKWNDRDLNAYLKNKEARSTHLDMLVFYLRLGRNVLGHTKPWDREGGAILNVEVIEALPDVLGQPLFVFNETMVKALLLVSDRTTTAAAAEFAAEPSGSVARVGVGGLNSGEGGTSAGGGGPSHGKGMRTAPGGASGGGGGSNSAKSRTGGRTGPNSGNSGTSSWGGERGASRRGAGGGRQGRGARAAPGQSASPLSGPAMAACGQRPPLVYTASNPTVASTFVRSRHVRLPLIAPAAAAATRPQPLLRGCS